MKFSTPFQIEDFFYFGVNTNADPGDEKFGIGLCQLYLGYYTKPHEIGGWCFGLCDENGCL